MDIQATKLELIKLISNTQSELLLDRLSHLLSEESGSAYAGGSVLSASETQLLWKINAGLPEALQSRYHELLQKGVNHTLSEQEQEEWLQLIPQIETHQAERLSYMVQLAALWNCSVPELMEKLQIEIPPLLLPDYHD